MTVSAFSIARTNRQCIQRIRMLQIVMLSSQPAITCSKLTVEALEQGVNYVQN